MLYVSRYFHGLNKLGVVDTDDGVESYHSSAYLSDVSMEYGIDILGMAETRFNYMPYQLPEATTPLQLKLRLMYGIETVIYKGKFAAFRWGRHFNYPDVVIRVSDMVSGFHDFCFQDNLDAAEIPLTLIFDDKLEPVGVNSLTPLFGSWVFSNAIALPVRFDLREVEDKKLALSLYRALRRNAEEQHCRWSELEDAVIDSERRKKALLTDKIPLPF